MNEKRYLARAKESSEFMSRFSESISEEQKRLSASYISSDNMKRLRHGSGWSINPADGETSSDFEKVETSHGLDLADIADNRISKLIEAIELTAESLHNQIVKSLYRTVSEAADSAGNTISAKDHSSLADTMYAALEKIEFAVDKEGNVCLPSFHVSPEIGDKLRELQENQDSETEAKFKSLIQKKSDLALSHEATRRANFLNYGGDP